MTKELTQKETIHLAMAAILKDIDAIAKSQKNQAQGFNFRGIDDVYNALHPIFAAHGVVCIPTVEKIDKCDFLNAKGNKVFHTHVTMRFRFTAADGSLIEAMTIGEGMDHGDKSTAKALSAAHKYLLLQTFLIPTADIVDADRYDPTIDPHEQLRAVREENAKQAVMKALAEGEKTELPQEQVDALAKKRAELEKKISEGQGTTKDAQVVTPKKEPEKTKEEPKPDQNGRKAPECSEYVISQIKLKDFAGRKLGDLSKEEITTIKTGWADKYREQINKNPAKKHEAEMIDFAFAEQE